MKHKIGIILSALFLLLWPNRMANAEDARIVSPRPNVLMIAVDDLNAWVHHLARNPQVITPNIDRLASMGVTFYHA